MKLTKAKNASYRACDPYNCAPTGSRPTLSAAPGASSIFGKTRLAGRLGAASGALALVIAGYAKRKRIFGSESDKKDQNNSVGNGGGTRTNNTGGGDQDAWILTDKERFFYSGNQQHFYHSLALMAVPYASKVPVVSTSLLLAGMTLYCGTQYYRSFQKEKVYAGRPLLWIGGLCLISAWFTFLV